MEALWLQLLNHDVWVPAVCDLAALSAMAGIVLVCRSGRSSPASSTQPVALATARRPEAAVPEPLQPVVSLAAEARTDVKRALAAIGRWEDSYRSGRGVAELARFVESQKPTREAVRSR